jgi:hypothetical protein
MLSVTWRLHKNIITNCACLTFPSVCQKCGRDDGKFENWLVITCGMFHNLASIHCAIAEKAAKLVMQ